MPWARSQSGTRWYGKGEGTGNPSRRRLVRSQALAWGLPCLFVLLVYLLETFPRQTQCQREKGLMRTAKPKLSWFSQFLVALFRIFGKATRWSSEDPKTHQVAQWRWSFFGSRGKKTNRGLRFERFSTERRFAGVPQVR